MIAELAEEVGIILANFLRRKGIPVDETTEDQKEWPFSRPQDHSRD